MSECWLGESEHHCPKCKGNGEYVCGRCKNEVWCVACDGTGWDVNVVDVKAYEAACRALPPQSDVLGSYSYESRDGIRLGRTNGKEHVLVADFLRGAPR